MAIAALMKKIQEQLHCPDPERASREKERAIQLATAGLLLDVAHADDEFSERERGDLMNHVSSQFGLEGAAALELLEAADRERKRSIDYFAFATLIRKNVALEERLEILRTLWRIVFADGVLNQHEEYLVRKLSELLGIERHIMIDEKLRVKRELGYQE